MTRSEARAKLNSLRNYRSSPGMSREARAESFREEARLLEVIAETSSCPRAELYDANLAHEEADRLDAYCVP